MLTIDEAIARERNLAEIYRNDIVPKEDYHNMPWINMVNEGNEKAAEEHEQLVEWLEELKANKVTSAEVYEQGYKRGYNKAINDCIKDVDKEEKQHNHTITKDCLFWLKSKFEQLKEQVNGN